MRCREEPGLFIVDLFCLLGGLHGGGLIAGMFTQLDLIRPLYFSPPPGTWKSRLEWGTSPRALGARSDPKELFKSTWEIHGPISRARALPRFQNRLCSFVTTHMGGVFFLFSILFLLIQPVIPVFVSTAVGIARSVPS